LNGAIDEARSVCHGLAPALLKEAPLGRLLQILALNTERQFDVSCVVTCDSPEGAFSDEMTLHLFRITQEALHNALTHGRAERIEIDLVHNEGRGVLSIRDNGVGISEEECHGGGIGLHSMAFRARVMGGYLKIRRRNAAGTAVICTFPWPEVYDWGNEFI
jgi:signal transduction histidine kinase